MSPEQFCYWLQGYAELATENCPSPDQWAVIKDHLRQVFDKKTTVTIKADTKDASKELVASIERAVVDATRQGGLLFDLTRPDFLPKTDPKPTLVC